MSHGFASPARLSNSQRPHDLHPHFFTTCPSTEEALSSAEQLLQDSCEGLLELQNLAPFNSDGSLFDPYQSSPEEHCADRSHSETSLLPSSTHSVEVQQAGTGELYKAFSREAGHGTACKHHDNRWCSENPVGKPIIKHDLESGDSMLDMHKGYEDQTCWQADDAADLEWDAWVAECLAAGPILPRSCSSIRNGSLLGGHEMYHQPRA